MFQVGKSKNKQEGEGEAEGGRTDLTNSLGWLRVAGAESSGGRGAEPAYIQHECPVHQSTALPNVVVHNQ